MKRTLVSLCIAGALFARTGDGIRPRGSAADYPAHEAASGVTIAAQALSPDQVRKLFATDLNKAGYLVFEVAVYPDNGKTVDLDQGDFMLRIGSDSTIIRAADPTVIASMLHQKNSPQPRTGKDVTLYPEAEVGYESGGYDPVTGRRTHGWYTGAGVGVATGGAAGPQASPPASTGRDQATMQQELEDKGLPQGKITRAVAGYLYFPKPSKARNALNELTWYGDNTKLSVSVPPPPK